MDAVLDDFETAPIAEGLRETLRFLQKVTLEPAAVGPEDAARVRAAGVSDVAIRDALYVCAGFNLIDRLADSFAFTPISHYVGAQGLLEHEAKFLARGYL